MPSPQAHSLGPRAPDPGEPWYLRLEMIRCLDLVFTTQPKPAKGKLLSDPHTTGRARTQLHCCVHVCSCVYTCVHAQYMCGPCMCCVYMCHVTCVVHMLQHIHALSIYKCICVRMCMYAQACGCISGKPGICHGKFQGPDAANKDGRKLRNLQG